MDPAEAAVRHDGDDVTIGEFRREMGNDRVCVGHSMCGLAVSVDAGDEFIDIQYAAECACLGRVIDARYDDKIGVRERLFVLVFKDREPRGARTRFKNGDQAPSVVLFSQGLERLVNGGWMMREVIDNGHSALDSSNLHTAFH